MLTHIFFIALGGAALWRGADWLVDAASRLARRFGLSDLVIGLTVVAIGTSAPEFAVTLTAALDGKGSLSLGNVVGSNIFNLGIILGGVALFGALPTSRLLVWRDGMVLLGATILLLLFLIDGTLSFWEGSLFLVGLITYLVLLLRNRESTTEEAVSTGAFSRWDLLRLIGGLSTVVLGGHLLVEHASQLATLFGLSDWLIGLTIVAIGTSLPELATSIMAALRGRLGLSAGNLIGSDLFNILGVLGLTAMVHSVTITRDLYPGLLLMTGQVVVVLLLLRTGWRLSRTEGCVLIGCGLARWTTSLV
ncbi:MAG: cation:H+ antiporter [Candidatus Latescibacterota bacterium]|jgi:cation:H+ antiporter